MRKGYRVERRSPSYVASSSGSGGGSSGAVTTLNKYKKPKSDRLEDIVSDSSKSIIKHRQAIAKISLKFLYPEGYYGLLLAKTLYKHRERIYKTIDDVVTIWSEDGPISEKIVKSGMKIVGVGADILKKEIKEKFISYVSSRFSEAVVEKIDEKGIIEKVANEVNLENHSDRFRDLLKDTIEKQTTDTLEELIGDV